MTLAVVILTHNEERHILRALASVAGIAAEVFVVDSFSTDRTVELARAQGATVLQNKFINYAKQTMPRSPHHGSCGLTPTR